MKSRIVSIAQKEFLHIFRDWRTLMMILGIPVVMLLLFGYAITFDIRNIRIAVYDGDKSPDSRKLVDRFVSGGYFKLVGMARSDEELNDMLDSGLTQIALSIPSDFSKNLGRNSAADVAVLVDGSESNTGTIATGYVQGILAQTTLDYSMAYISSLGASRPPKIPPIRLDARFWYNPELRSQNFIVPGLMASILMIITAMLTSLSIVREKERGSLEQLIATPVRKHEIVLGKLLPYFVVGMFDSVLVAVVGAAVFAVPFEGSVWLFMVGTAIFALAGLGIGIFISIVAQNQVMAMQMALLSSMLPSFLLSGFMFAIKNMPDWVQAITYIVPARYFLVIIRGIFLKDSDIFVLWPQFTFLTVLAFVLLVGSIRKFKKKIG